MSAIYLDHNSTSPMSAEAIAAMATAAREAPGNPASQHTFGRRARQLLEDCREEIGRLLGARGGRQADRVIFTSGGTEANNLALLGLADAVAAKPSPAEAVFSEIEHASVEACAQTLVRRGWTIRRLATKSSGVVDVDSLEPLLNERTRFVTLMLANNETGAIQPVEAVARLCAVRGIPLHTDAVQMAGKLSVNFTELGASSMSVGAHKFHGPLGIGALIVRRELPLAPLFHGGFQQESLRPGTECVVLAAGMRAALAASVRDADQRVRRQTELRDRLESQLTQGYAGGVVINAHDAPRLPQTSNLALLGMNRQALAVALDLAGVACATGSACASGSREPSRVLKAMGCSPEVLSSSLRFSLGAETTREEIDIAVERILAACARIVPSKTTVRSR